MTFKIAFVDLDGCVNASSDVRAHLVPTYTDKSSYWAEWHKAHVNEAINPAAVVLVKALHAAGYWIHFLSSRQASCFDSTTSQLKGALGDDIGFMLSLRPALDDQPMGEYKAGVIGAVLFGAYMAGKVEEKEVLIVEDNAKVAAAIHADDGIKHLTDRGIIKLSTILLQTFKG